MRFLMLALFTSSYLSAEDRVLRGLAGWKPALLAVAAWPLEGGRYAALVG